MERALLHEQEIGAQMQRHVVGEIFELDLEQGPLMRVLLVDGPEEQQRLFLAIQVEPLQT